MTGLIRLGAVGAMLGGALRIIAAFVPYDPAAAWLELLYAAIDLGLMFALIGLAVDQGERLGRLGLVPLVIAIAAIASIIGPDSRAFGIDWYMAGAGLFLAALATLSLVMLKRDVERVVAWGWLIAFGLGCLMMVTPNPLLLAASGVALGASFVALGLGAMRLRVEQHPLNLPNRFGRQVHP